jgi:hypothetical protein
LQSFGDGLNGIAAPISVTAVCGDVATDGVVELQQLFVGLLGGSIAALEYGTLNVLYCLYILL